MRCRRCTQKAVVDLKSHHTAFCRDCFFFFVERQVERSVAKHRMFAPDEKVLICVSGGKDSLALWDVLHRLGYETEGLYIDLGIGDYSKRSGDKVRAFAQKNELPLTVVDLEAQGIPIPKLAKRSRRGECSLCGTVKRHFFNAVAKEKGASVVATGHNLDDEAGRLLGNVLHWQMEYLAKQSPVLPAVGDMLIRKVEPLCRLSERETAAYAVLRGIDYVLEECPMSRGATSMQYKEIMNLLEDKMPGTKMNFFNNFLKTSDIFKLKDNNLLEDYREPTVCSSCGFPSYLDPCNFCRLTKED